MNLQPRILQVLNSCEGGYFVLSPEHLHALSSEIERQMRWAHDFNVIECYCHIGHPDLSPAPPDWSPNEPHSTASHPSP